MLGTDVSSQFDAAFGLILATGSGSVILKTVSLW